MSNKFIYQDQEFAVGDSISVHQIVQEDDKTRTQIFDGILIATKGRGDNRTFTVRKIAANSVGVEKIFPVKSPLIKNITRKSKGNIRRAKLYYLRERTGRRALRVKGAAARATQPKSRSNSRKTGSKTPAK